jgi:hypothetical protein
MLGTFSAPESKGNKFGLKMALKCVFAKGNFIQNEDILLGIMLVR